MKEVKPLTMSWTDDDVHQLVELFRRRPCLYDEHHESFNDETKKLEMLKELAEIISGSRPGTSIEDVMKKWDEIRTQFLTAYLKNKKSKKKISSDIIFFEKMKFILNYQNTCDQSKDEEQDSVKGNQAVEKIKGHESRRMKVSVARYNPKSEQQKAEVNCVSMEPESKEISLISVKSDDSGNLEQFGSPVTRKKKRQSVQVTAENSTSNDISYFSLTSPQVAVNDSILDRTEPFVNESDSFTHMRNSSLNLGDSFLKDDEDTLYVKYLLCKLRKLDESSKLRIKVEIERLFYQSLTG